MFYKKLTSIFSLFVLGFFSTQFMANAQSGLLVGQDTTRRPITTAVPFLTISPDARAGGMGDLGVATSPDANATYWNPAKLAFLEDQWGASLSYTPWLRQLVNDMYLSYLTGYYKIDDLQAVGVSMSYFNLGSIQFTTDRGDIIRDFTPRELSVSATYSRKLSETFSMAVAGRYIHSNLTADLIVGSGNNQTETKPGNTGAADIAMYYENDNFNLGGYESTLTFGANISNIGAKISYSDRNQRDFIPTMLRLGAGINTKFDEFNSLAVYGEMSKLMVPSPPLRDGQNNIVQGTDPRDQTVLQGVFGSFGDAVDGFSEEMQEMMWALGLEYWYQDLFAARAGYFNEHNNKGGRKYFTIGVGVRYQKFGLDVAYLIPQSQNNPLAETLRFTFHFSFDEKESKS